MRTIAKTLLVLMLAVFAGCSGGDDGPRKIETTIIKSVMDSGDIAFRVETEEELTGYVTYTWDFGDGETSMLMSPVHSYSASGLFPVSVSFVDGAGNTGSDTMFVRSGFGIVLWSPWVGILGLLLALGFYLYIKKLPVGTEKMRQLSEHIHNGAMV
ncbi:MAG TPA: PKD domain-containing protein, partial [bacterium]|nr:PKD domain-containing protein [bacterium]